MTTHLPNPVAALVSAKRSKLRTSCGWLLCVLLSSPLTRQNKTRSAITPLELFPRRPRGRDAAPREGEVNWIPSTEQHAIPGFVASTAARFTVSASCAASEGAASIQLRSTVEVCRSALQFVLQHNACRIVARDRLDCNHTAGDELKLRNAQRPSTPRQHVPTPQDEERTNSRVTACCAPDGIRSVLRQLWKNRFNMSRTHRRSRAPPFPVPRRARQFLSQLTRPQLSSARKAQATDPQIHAKTLQKQCCSVNPA